MHRCIVAVAIGALMSSMVGPKNQGELFGANACIDTAAVAAGKYLFNAVLNFSVSDIMPVKYVPRTTRHTR
jgi:hypothetical protein